MLVENFTRGRRHAPRRPEHWPEASDFAPTIPDPARALPDALTVTGQSALSHAAHPPALPRPKTLCLSTPKGDSPNLITGIAAAIVLAKGILERANQEGRSQPKSNRLHPIAGCRTPI